MDFILTWLPGDARPSNLQGAPHGLTIQTISSPPAGDVSLNVGAADGAGVWWDKTTDALCVRRDPMGRYPMAWRRLPKGLQVSSNVSLLKTDRINWRRLSRWLEGCDDCDVDDLSEDVFRIRPGELIRWASPTSLTVKAADEPARERLDFEEICASVDAALRETVSRYSDAAITLSDGVDSMLIASTATSSKWSNWTMTSAFKHVCRVEMVESFCARTRQKTHYFPIDSFVPFRKHMPWQGLGTDGLVQFPGSAYERPFFKSIVDAKAPPVILSGFGADQMFFRSPHLLVRWGIRDRDDAAVQMGLDALTRRQVLALPLASSSHWRKLRIKRIGWASDAAFLKYPTFERHSPYFLDGWFWEAATRNLRQHEIAIDTPIVLPLANERMMNAIAPFSHSLHFGPSNKPILRNLLKRQVGHDLAAAPKSTSFTPIFTNAMASLTSQRIRDSLTRLWPILDFESAISHFEDESALLRKSMYLVAGDALRTEETS